MRRLALRLAGALLMLGLGVSPAQGQGVQPDPLALWIGRSVVAVEIRIEGKPDTTPALLAMVDVHPGDRLTPEAWRRVATRLNQVPRFEDVSVGLEERGGGVVLIFDLMPRHPIEDVTFSDTAGVSTADLKRQLRERFNGLPSPTELADVEEEVTRILGHEGYLSATATANINKFHDPDRAILEVAVNAGPRALIADWVIRGKSPIAQAQLEARLGLTKGAPYRDRALATRLAAIREDLRSKHYYKAIAQNLTATVSGDGTQASLVIVVEAGPIVEWTVRGKLPGSEDEFLPIKRQNSVDEDLLEEAKLNIEQRFARDGYFHPHVEYASTQPTPDSLLVTFTVDRGKRYRIMALDLPAGLHLSEGTFSAQKSLEVGAWFDKVGVENALASVTREYQDLGFHRVGMKPKYEEVPGRNADEGGIVIHPNITEGPQATITDVTFDLGDRPIVTERELADLMKSKARQVYSLANLVEDRRDVPAHYQGRGFLNSLATVTPNINLAGTEVRLAVFAREGPQIFVGEIVVLGNDRVKSDVILGEMTLRAGQPYSEQARLTSQRALNGLPSLKSSRIAVGDRLPGETTVRIVVSVEESDSTTVEPGGGLEVGSHPRAAVGGGLEDRIEFAPRASLSVGRRNLGGRDRAVNLFGRVSFKPKNAPGDPVQDGHGFGFTEYRVTGTYNERHAFRSATNLLVTMTSEQAIRTSFNFVRRVGTASVFRSLTPRVTVLGGYRLEWTRLFDVIIDDPNDQPLIDRLFPQVRLSIFSAGVVFDRRTDPRNPSLGVQANANLDVAVPQLGSEVGFAKSFTQASIVRAVPGTTRLVAGFRAQLGLARGFERIAFDAAGNPVVLADLPASQRFFAGGSTTVRSFQLDRLGVEEILNDNGLSNGGNGLIVINAELRAQAGKLFKRDLSVVGFFDTGNVFHRASDLDLSRLRSAVGFGVRYDSPLGPLRVDVGFKTDRMIFPNYKERRWEFHLSLGEVF